MAKNTLPIAQMVTVNTKAAAAIWNMGINKWKKLFDRSLRKYIRHYSGDHDKRYVLVDVMALAYPGADKKTLYSLCLEYTMQQADLRTRKNRQNREREDRNNEEPT